MCIPMIVCAHDAAVYCDACKPSKGWLDQINEGFITKDSGKREEYESGMVRDTQEGKPGFHYLFVDGIPYDEQFLTRWSALMSRGAEKYGAKNYQKADSEEELERFKASAARHFAQWMCGEVDEDHSVAVAFNLMAAEMVKWKLAQSSEDM